MSQQKKAAQEKRKSRADRFWNSFLFTEKGKPKSSFLVYTFCMSFVFMLVYVLCYEAAIRVLTTPLANLVPWQANLVISLAASALGVFVCCLPHRFFKDKRLVFATHMWLVLYAAAVMITMFIIMKDPEGRAAFLNFIGWFVAVPVGLGTLVSGLLCRRDHHPQQEKEAEPEWKKYVQRR